MIMESSTLKIDFMSRKSIEKCASCGSYVDEEMSIYCDQCADGPFCSLVCKNDHFKDKHEKK
jgi:hypothetical protein